MIVVPGERFTERDMKRKTGTFVVVLMLALVGPRASARACGNHNGGFDDDFYRERLRQEATDYAFAAKNGLREEMCDHARIAKDLAITLCDQAQFDLWKERAAKACKEEAPAKAPAGKKTSA